MYGTHTKKRIQNKQNEQDNQKVRERERNNNRRKRLGKEEEEEEEEEEHKTTTTTTTTTTLVMSTYRDGSSPVSLAPISSMEVISISLRENTLRH
jgi:hypothetical protein